MQKLGFCTDSSTQLTLDEANSKWTIIFWYLILRVLCTYSYVVVIFSCFGAVYFCPLLYSDQAICFTSSWQTSTIVSKDGNDPLISSNICHELLCICAKYFCTTYRKNIEEKFQVMSVYLIVWWQFQMQNWWLCIWKFFCHHVKFL